MENAFSNNRNEFHWNKTANFHPNLINNIFLEHSILVRGVRLVYIRTILIHFERNYIQIV